MRELTDNYSGGYFQGGFNAEHFNPARRHRDQNFGGGARGGVPLNPSMIVNDMNGLDANGMNSAQ